MYELHFYPDTCALAPHAVLEALGTPYRLRLVDFRLQAQRGAAYRRINPLGRVPALVDGDTVVTETPAILGWLARRHAGHRLAPVDDVDALARVESFHGFLSSTVHVAHAHRMRGARWADDPAAIEAMRRKVPDAVGELFRLIEDHWLRDPWVHGDTLTTSDYYLFTLAQWLEADGVDPARLPRVIAHRVRMAARPEVARAIAAERALLAG